MTIYASIDGRPTDRYKVVRKRLAPRVGDMIVVRGYGEDWEEQACVVREIKSAEVPVYILLKGKARNGERKRKEGVGANEGNREGAGRRRDNGETVA